MISYYPVFVRNHYNSVLVTTYKLCVFYVFFFWFWSHFLICFLFFYFYYYTKMIFQNIFHFGFLDHQVEIFFVVLLSMNTEHCQTKKKEKKILNLVLACQHWTILYQLQSLICNYCSLTIQPIDNNRNKKTVKYTDRMTAVIPRMSPFSWLIKVN